jgi:hypothetical protein
MLRELRERRRPATWIRGAACASTGGGFHDAKQDADTRAAGFKRLLADNTILTLDEAAGVLARRDVPQGDVAL